MQHNVNTPNEGWIFKKEINITHIIATVSLVISALVFGTSMDKRIELNSTNIQHLSNSQARMEQRHKEFRSEMKNDFKGVHAKLDRLLERGNK